MYLGGDKGRDSSSSYSSFGLDSGRSLFHSGSTATQATAGPGHRMEGLKGRCVCVYRLMPHHCLIQHLTSCEVYLWMRCQPVESNVWSLAGPGEYLGPRRPVVHRPAAGKYTTMKDENEFEAEARCSRVDGDKVKLLPGVEPPMKKV